MSKHAELLSRHIDEADYLVVDVETTGLSADGGDRVCEVGAVLLRGNAVVDTFGTLVDPCRPIAAGAYAVNHISPQMLEGAPEFPAVAERLQAMMDGAVLVAYNTPFDLSFLSMEFRLAGFPPIGNYTVDTLVIARQLIPGLSTYRQEHVARTAGVPSPVTHRALQDAMTTAHLFMLFTSVLKAHHCQTVADLGRKDLKRVLAERRGQLISEAVDGRKDLWVRFVSPLTGEIDETIVTPRGQSAGTGPRDEAGYLVGFCKTTNVVKDFRIDRILDIRVVR
jgi:DNA polymerase III subunit epsilon